MFGAGSTIAAYVVSISAITACGLVILIIVAVVNGIGRAGE